MNMDRQSVLFWTLGAAGLGLVRYFIMRGQYQRPSNAAAAAAASTVGDLAGMAIPQIQNPAMLLAAQQAQAAARQFYQRVPQSNIDPCKTPPEKPMVILPVRDAEFEIIEEKKE